MAVGRRNRGLFGTARAFAVAALVGSTATSAFVLAPPIKQGHVPSAEAAPRGGRCRWGVCMSTEVGVGLGVGVDEGSAGERGPAPPPLASIARAPTILFADHAHVAMAEERSESVEAVTGNHHRRRRRQHRDVDEHMEPFDESQEWVVSEEMGQAMGEGEDAAPVRGILDPALIDTIRYQLGGAEDEVLHEFFSDYTSTGPMAAMRHLGSPKVASRLAALMAEATVHVHTPSPPLGGWCR